MKGIITGRRTEKTDPTFFTSGVERVLYYTNPPYDVSIIKKKQVQKRDRRKKSMQQRQQQSWCTSSLMITRRLISLYIKGELEAM
jgi:K+-sensing histidine kinase KdpD